MDVFGLDLSLVARLGGHSAPRTHRGKERFPGMTITYALIQMVEKIAEVNSRLLRRGFSSDLTCPCSRGNGKIYLLARMFSGQETMRSEHGILAMVSSARVDKARARTV